MTRTLSIIVQDVGSGVGLTGMLADNRLPVFASWPSADQKSTLRVGELKSCVPPLKVMSNFMLSERVSGVEAILKYATRYHYRHNHSMNYCSPDLDRR